MKRSHLKSGMLVATLSAAVVACEAPVTSPDLPAPSFAVVENSRTDIPVNFFLFPPCNGEPTESQGTVHVVFSVTETPSGQTNVRFHLNANGTGVGLTTGAKYQWNDAINEGFSVDENDGLPYTETIVRRIRFIGQGQVPDGYFDVLIHATINANGEPTAAKFEISFECK